MSQFDQWGYPKYCKLLCQFRKTFVSIVVVATKVYETICPRMYMAFSVESQTEKWNLVREVVLCWWKEINMRIGTYYINSFFWKRTNEAERL